MDEKVAPQLTEHQAGRAAFVLAAARHRKLVSVDRETWAHVRKLARTRTADDRHVA